MPGGGLVRLRDLASIRRVWKTLPFVFIFVGNELSCINICEITGDDALKIAKSVHEYVRTAKANLPPGISLSVYRDQSVDLRSGIPIAGQQRHPRIFFGDDHAVVVDELAIGWVVAGLPVSMLGTFWLMWSFGDHNQHDRPVGILLVIGILVDDAIVVGENIYSHVERGVPPMRAAVNGTLEVMPAVLASVTTTMVAFMPLFFMGGIVEDTYVIPVVVIAALAFQSC